MSSLSCVSILVLLFHRPWFYSGCKVNLAAPNTTEYYYGLYGFPAAQHDITWQCLLSGWGTYVTHKSSAHVRTLLWDMLKIFAVVVIFKVKGEQGPVTVGAECLRCWFRAITAPIFSGQSYGRAAREARQCYCCCVLFACMLVIT